MTDSEFHIGLWAVTLGIGLPVLVVIASKRWREAQTTFLWRAVICMIAACVFTPCVQSEDFGRVATVDVFPAVVALVSAPVGAARGEQGVSLEGFVGGLIPILMVACVFFAVWSVIIRVRREQAR